MGVMSIWVSNVAQQCSVDNQRYNGNGETITSGFRSIVLQYEKRKGGDFCF